MRIRAVTLVAALMLLADLGAARAYPQSKTFERVQERYPRVRTAQKEKDELLRQRFREKNLAFPPRAILLRAFKKEAALELWATDAKDKPYVLVHEYRICTSSRTLGPKRRFGDEQVPEGFYELDWFNPQSNFFLSLHISYPNASDRILGSHSNPGETFSCTETVLRLGASRSRTTGSKKCIGSSCWCTTKGGSVCRLRFFRRD